MGLLCVWPTIRHSGRGKNVIYNLEKSERRTPNLLRGWRAEDQRYSSLFIEGLTQHSVHLYSGWRLLKLSIVTTGGQTILYCGSCPVHYRMVSSTPVLEPSCARRNGPTSFTSSCDNRRYLLTFIYISTGGCVCVAKSPLLRMTVWSQGVVISSS